MVLNLSTEKYFTDFKLEVDKIYDLAKEAKKTGLDPVNKIEIPLAMTMAAKVVGLISTIYPQMMDCGIDERILELERQFGKLDPTVVFKIAEEIAKQKFCSFENTLQAMDAGIRVGFAYTTLGVVSSPIEGYTGIKTRKTKDGKEYIEASFSGPIRSAGTTASCLVITLIDYMRELFGYAKYDPTEEEIKRFAIELDDFHERVSNLQYKPTEEEALFLARRMPIQIAGDASEKIEVSNYKNLERVETNFLRSGFCLVLAEGLAQKAAKGFRLYNQAKKNGVQMTGFDWLGEYVEFHEARNKGKKGASGPPTYIKDLVAGRPIYGHPSRSGGLRFRYGIARNSGFSAAGMHPATMGITEDFIAIGTQLKIEKPTKGCVTTVCDTIDGPIVKLKNGSVKRLYSLLEARKIYQDVEEIIYLGDILFPFQDVINRNYELVKPGFVEEWWGLLLKEKDEKLYSSLDILNIDFDYAVSLCKQYSLPLYPKYIFYWSQISKEQFVGLINWIKKSKLSENLILPYNKEEQEIFSEGKRALELLGIPHEVTIENVVLDNVNSKSLFFNLGIDISLLNLNSVFPKDFFSSYFLDSENILEIINKNCSLEIKDKAGDFIGTRMGRPEKAKLRKLTGSPNTLFPVGSQGGRLRSVQAAMDVGKVKNSFSLFYCEDCSRETIYTKCEVCGKPTIKKYYFSDIKETASEQKIENSEREGTPYKNIDLDINHYMEYATKNLGLIKSDVPLLIKGVRGLSCEDKIPENLAKGILRAKHNLQVNKDGTIRFDGTELPLTVFKPAEVEVKVERLKELGYTKDIYGNDLVNDEQVLQLMPHDILLPSCPATPDEKADDVFVNIANFVDDELVRFYKLKPFYNIKTREDLVGHLGVCMAPHNCAGVVCRIVGFSKVLGIMASPYMHAAIRRDCDGDEAAIMLLGDVLLNFSRKFLPSHRGGTQDAPLVLNARIDAGEVDDQILDFEFVQGAYPLELYQKAELRKHSSEIKEIVTCRKILKEGKDPFVGMGFTHDTKNFNEGVLCSAYKLLPTMKDKVAHQMELVEKIRAVDTVDTARLIIERHFIRDMRGNLRKFSMQGFRCVACNEIMRRPPLSGVCPKCSGKIIFTIHEGGIKKYLEPAIELTKKYDLSPYLKQTIQLVKGYIDSIFGRELEKQSGLNEFF